MDNTLRIREADINDIELIRDLTFKVWPQTYASILTQEQIEYMLEKMYSKLSLEKQMVAEGCQFIIVYDGDKPIGFASFGEIAPSIYKLHKLYILQTVQGKGAGRFAIDYIINKIAPLGATALQLQVNRYNKAKSFYEKLGFEEIDKIKLDIGGGFFMDDFVMQKEVTKVESESEE